MAMPSATDIEGGLFTTCAATVNGIYCWDLLNPVVTLVPGTYGRAWRRVSIGDGHSCALDDTGMPWCWGENGAGQLGDGTTTTRTTPVRAVFDY
ncbi:MAG: RCC1 domain-containing protein [Gemmatimonadales bacterium]